MADDLRATGWTLSGLSQDALLAWVRQAARRKTHILARGYQGHVHLYEEGGHPLVIKAVEGRGPLAWLRRHMLRKEYAVYRRLAAHGYPWCPHCHGLLAGRYLVLDFVPATPLRHRPPGNPERFYGRLLEAIRRLHALGLAHSDLKRQDNTLVREDDEPCLIDFGTTVTWKPGFAPLNHLLFRIACQYDYNAWIKLKYRGRRDAVTGEDAAFYRLTLSERLARALRLPYRNLKRRLASLLRRLRAR